MALQKIRPPQKIAALDPPPVPSTRKINGQKLDKDLILTAADVNAAPSNTLFLAEQYTNQQIALIVSLSTYKISQYPAGVNNRILVSLGAGIYKVPEGKYVAGKIQIIRINQPLMENSGSPIENGYTQTSPA